MLLCIKLYINAVSSHVAFGVFTEGHFDSNGDPNKSYDTAIKDFLWTFISVKM